MPQLCLRLRLSHRSGNQEEQQQSYNHQCHGGLWVDALSWSTACKTSAWMCCAGWNWRTRTQTNWLGTKEKLVPTSTATQMLHAHWCHACGNKGKGEVGGRGVGVVVCHWVVCGALVCVYLARAAAESFGAFLRRISPDLTTDLRAEPENLAHQQGPPCLPTPPPPTRGSHALLAPHFQSLGFTF